MQKIQDHCDDADDPRGPQQQSSSVPPPFLPKTSKQSTLLYWLMDSHRKEVNEEKEAICKEMELVSQARGLMYVNKAELLLEQRAKSVEAVQACLHILQEQNRISINRWDMHQIEMDRYWRRTSRMTVHVNIKKIIFKWCGTTLFLVSSEPCSTCKYKRYIMSDIFIWHTGSTLTNGWHCWIRVDHTNLGVRGYQFSW